MSRQGTLRGFPLSKLFPSMVTLLGLCIGLSAIRFAILERWEMAIGLLVIAAFIDGVDGRLARMLNATSKFGAELDSLTDFVNFGVTPPIVIYFWKMDELHIRGLGWALTLFFIICMALRLARFNAMLDDKERPKWADWFFSGVPAPVSAGMSLVPIMLSFQIGEGFWTKPGFVAIYLTTVAVFTASTIPTFSSKKIRIPHELVSIALVIFAAMLIALVIEPWITLPLMGVAYVASIPFSILVYYRFKHGNAIPPGDDED